MRSWGHRIFAAPRYLRSLSVVDDYAVLNLFEGRRDHTFDGLPFDAEMALEDADAHHTEVTVPLHGRLQEIRDAMWAAESAKNESWTARSDPVPKASLADAQKALADARQNVATLRTQIEDGKAQVRSDRAVAERAKGMLNGEKQAEEALDRAKQHERKVAECEA
ncbi:MAG: hypothetical protein ABSG53_28480 [Thermoguttaceae bacterium]|jgi:hypothetical protein